MSYEICHVEVTEGSPYYDLLTSSEGYELVLRQNIFRLWQ
jgi:hypothetical protein